MNDNQEQIITSALEHIAVNTPTLRDQFAIAALQGMLAAIDDDIQINPEYHGLSTEQAITAQCYVFADAMMEARK